MARPHRAPLVIGQIPQSRCDGAGRRVGPGFMLVVTLAFHHPDPDREDVSRVLP
jgi:hypothetical protein